MAILHGLLDPEDKVLCSWNVRKYSPSDKTSCPEELNPLPSSWKSCICMTTWIAVHDPVAQKNIHCLRGVPRVFCVLLSASRSLLLGDSDPCIWCLRGEFRRFPRHSCSWSERSLFGLTWPFPSWGNNNHIKQLNPQNMFEISGSTVIMCLSQLHASNCCHKLPALNGL